MNYKCWKTGTNEFLSKKTELKKIKGKLTVLYNGDIYVGKRLIENDEKILIPVSTLKQIIKDNQRRRRKWEKIKI